MKRPELSARTVPCFCDLGIFEAAPAGESPDPPRRGGGVEVRVTPAALSRGWWSVSGFEPLTSVELQTGAAELPSALWQQPCGHGLPHQIPPERSHTVKL